MTSTTLDGVMDGQGGRLMVTASLPSSPVGYYGNRVKSDEWHGGEIIFNSGDSRLYIQTSTSGKTAIWKRIITIFTAV